MKIVTWNVNGLKAVLNRRFGSIRSLLQYLKADVVCIQETKLSKADVERFRELAICEGWDSYFSFCRIRGGYAGLISQNSMVGSNSPAADNEAAASSPAAPAGIHADTKQVPKDTPFVDRFTASDLWTECMGSDHCPVWADLDVPVPHLPKGFLPPALSTSHKFAGKANTISSWLTHSMTAATTSSRGRKRPRREEEDTPPRVSLEELEQQDRAQQKPRFGRAGLNQPFAAADQQPSPGRKRIPMRQQGQ
ncbi:hypothetical protein WJX79_002785 [Trebouxia sp. C0005]